MHGASGKAWVMHPLEERNGHVSDYPFRLLIDDFAVLHLDVDGLTTVQTRSVDVNGFPRK